MKNDDNLNDEVDWIDDLISELVVHQDLALHHKGAPMLPDYTRSLLNHQSFLQSTSKQHDISYFLRTLSSIIHQDSSNSKVDFIVLFSKHAAHALQLDGPSSEGFPGGMVGLLEGCRQKNQQLYRECTHKIIRELLELGEFEEARVYAEEFKLVRETIDMFDTVISSEVIELDKTLRARDGLFELLLDQLDDGGNQIDLVRIKQNIQEVGEQRLVVVDPKGQKGVRDGIIFVNDLQTGFQISKNGGTLYIQNGDYSTQSFFSVALPGGSSKTLNVIGESTCETCINGAVTIQTEGTVTFQNIKFEIGDCAESNAAINVFSGEVVFDGCILECFVNTAIYVHGGATSDRKTTVRLRACLVEGLQSCQRVFGLEKGVFTDLEVTSTYFNEMLSVLSWFSPRPANNVNISFNNSFFNQIQDGLRVELSEASNVHVEVKRSSFNLVLYNEDSPSSAVAFSSTKALHTSAMAFSSTKALHTSAMALSSDKALHTSAMALSSDKALPNSAMTLKFVENLVDYQHTQGSGIDVCGALSCLVQGSSFRTGRGIDRRLSTSVGALLAKVKEAVFESNYITGFRIGIKVSGKCDLIIKKSNFTECSLGLSISKEPQQSCKAVSSCSLEGTVFTNVFNGIVCEAIHATVDLVCCRFTNVLIPLLTNKKAKSTRISDCQSTRCVDISDTETDLHQPDHLDVNSAATSLTEFNRHVMKSDALVVEASPDDFSQGKQHPSPDDDLKLLLIVEKNLPFQVEVDRNNTQSITIT